MNESNNRPMLFVSAPVPLTEKQEETILASLRKQLATDPRVALLPPGFTVQCIDAETQIAILAELRSLRADIAKQHELANACHTRMTP